MKTIYLLSISVIIMLNTHAQSDLQYSSIWGDSFGITFKPGEGDGRLYIISEHAIGFVPVDSTNYGNPGTEVAPGEFVAAVGSFYSSGEYHVSFKGLNSGSGLKFNTLYHFRVFDKKGNGGEIIYFTSTFLEGSQTTRVMATVGAGNFEINEEGSDYLDFGFVSGNGDITLVVAKPDKPVTQDPVDYISYFFNISDCNFNGQGSIGDFARVVFRAYNYSGDPDGSGSHSWGVCNLLEGTTYYFALYEAGGQNFPLYLKPAYMAKGTTLGAPRVQALSAAPGNITDRSMELNWIPGTGQKRIILMKEGSPVSAVPENNTEYTADSVFGAGSQLRGNSSLADGNFVVYKDSGSSVIVTNLEPGKTYYYAVFEYNAFSNGRIDYLAANPATDSVTTLGSLPVTWLYFNGIADENNITLQWATASEQNSRHFEIERSADNTNFSSIGMVKAAGKSTTVRKYVFKDISPLPGNYFYRIKQVDLDEKFTRSFIINVIKKFAGKVKVYPSPASSVVTIELPSSDLLNTLAMLYNNRGQWVQQVKILSTQQIINIEPLPAGIYYLKFSDGTTLKIQKK